MENNKLIAEFMGVVFHDDENQYYSSDGICIGMSLQYQTSWDWLMPVIEKIGTHTLSYTIEMLSEYYYKDGDNQDGLDGIEEFYKAVVFWIKENNYKTI